MLEFKPITRGQAGPYLCSAENSVGRSSTEQTIVDVLYAPTILSTEPRVQRSVTVHNKTVSFIFIFVEVQRSIGIKGLITLTTGSPLQRGRQPEAEVPMAAEAPPGAGGQERLRVRASDRGRWLLRPGRVHLQSHQRGGRGT